MTDTTWTDIGTSEQYLGDGRTCVEAKGTHLIIIPVDGELYAIENRCPHAGLPLADGAVNGKVLTCPYHGFTYHIGSGKNIDDPDHGERARTFPVRIDAGRTLVQLHPSQTDQPDHE